MWRQWGGGGRGGGGGVARWSDMTRHTSLVFDGIPPCYCLALCMKINVMGEVPVKWWFLINFQHE